MLTKQKPAVFCLRNRWGLGQRGGGDGGSERQGRACRFIEWTEEAGDLRGIEQDTKMTSMNNQVMPFAKSGI